MPESWLEEFDEYWSARERFLRSDPKSPLKPEERKKFSGLRYYPPDPAFKVKARFSRTIKDKEVELRTTAGNTVKLPFAGELRFTIGGNEFRLLAFKREGSSLFVPFCDRTNGSETCSIGRYVEIELHEGAESIPVTLDFNFAYNPDFTYDQGCDSVIPPAENRLDIPIKAGEKSYFSQRIR
ncbi:MAG: DUF1684 domain-containing protein [Conexivisphaerales archaeon]